MTCRLTLSTYSTANCLPNGRLEWRPSADPGPHQESSPKLPATPDGDPSPTSLMFAPPFTVGGQEFVRRPRANPHPFLGLTPLSALLMDRSLSVTIRNVTSFLKWAPSRCDSLFDASNGLQ